MARSAILTIKILSDARKAKAGLDETASKVSKFKDSIDKLAPAATAATLGIGYVAKKAFDQASALEQSTGAVASVFGAHSREITKFAKGAWREIGLSQNQFNEAASLLGSQLKNLGMPMDKVGGQTIELTKLGADLAATFGGTTADAVGALSALLRGERDPIERYGVSINEAAVKAKMAQLGLVGLTGEAEKNAKLQATLALLTEQTSAAQGQFAREANTAAGTAQIMRAQWENVGAQLAEVLLPVVSELTQHLTNFASWVSANPGLVRPLIVGFTALAGSIAVIKPIKSAIEVFGAVGTAAKIAGSGVGHFALDFVSGVRDSRSAASAFTGVAGTLGGAVAKIGTSIGTAVKAGAAWAAQMTLQTGKLLVQKAAIVGITIAKNAAAAAQRLWNLAMSMNPMGIIITAVIGAIALLIANWEKVRPVVEKVWESIKIAGQWVWENILKPIGAFIAGTFTKAWEGFKNIAVGAWESIKIAGQWVWENILKPIGNFIIGYFSNVWKIYKTAAVGAWQGLKAAGGFVYEKLLKPIGNFIAGTFTKAWEGFKNIITGAFDFLINSVRTVIDLLKEAWDWIQKVIHRGRNSDMALTASYGIQSAPGLTYGEPITAARISLPQLPRVAAAMPTKAETTNHINIHIPNYMGDKNEIVALIRDSLKQLERRRTGVI